MSGIIRAPRHDHYLVVAREVARDARLSYRARGVLIAMLSHADGWRCTAEDLARAGKEGRGAVLAALRELRAAGYMRVERRQDARGHWRTQTYVYDLPQATRPEATEVQKPDSGGPDVGGPAGIRIKNEKKKEAAAGTPAAAPVEKTHPPKSEGKKRTRRASGIVTWTSADEVEAASIEAQVDPAVLAQAVRGLEARALEALPGRVRASLSAACAARDKEAASADAEARRQVAACAGEVRALERLIDAAPPPQRAALERQLAAARDRAAQQNVPQKSHNGPPKNRVSSGYREGAEWVLSD